MKGHKETNITLITLYYQANISTTENDSNDKAYLGMTSLNWKCRYYNPLQSFRNPTLRNRIELGLTPVINWNIIKRSSSTNSLHGKCNLCLEEKICILKYLNGNLLIYYQSKMISAFRKRNKFLE